MAFHRLEAYQGGEGDLLYTPHHLDIADKHRVLTPVINVVVFKDFSPKKIDPGCSVTEWSTNGASFVIDNPELEKPFTWMIGPSSTPLRIVRKNLKEQTQRTKTLVVSFGGEPKALAYTPVILALASMAERVEWAINVIAEAF